MMMYLKLLLKQEQANPQSSTWKESTKIRTEINEMETKRKTQQINGVKRLALGKHKQNWQTYTQTNKPRKEKTQINKIRNEKGDIITNTNKIQNIIQK
jgi:hypothetical protein